MNDFLRCEFKVEDVSYSLAFQGMHDLIRLLHQRDKLLSAIAYHPEFTSDEVKILEESVSDLDDVLAAMLKGMRK